MSDADKLLPALENVEDLSLNQTLLEHYTSLTEHHRTKLSVLGTTYLVLAQLMLLTPLKTVSDAISASDTYIFALMLGAIISLVLLGLLHHAANMAVIAGQRLNILRNIYWIRLPKTLQDPDEYTTWRLAFETRNRDTSSLSRPSLVFLVVLAVPIFGLTIWRYNTLVIGILPKEPSTYILLGAFYALQGALFFFYLQKIFRRALHFSRIRDAYKAVQSAKSRTECIDKLRGDFAPTTRTAG
jgi:hypothetical protein